MKTKQAKETNETTNEAAVFENQTDTINLNIPLRINLCGKRSETEKLFIAMEHLEIRANTLFNLIGNASFLAQNGDMSKVEALSASEILSELGAALLEAVSVEREKLESHLKRHQTA